MWFLVLFIGLVFAFTGTVKVVEEPEEIFHYQKAKFFDVFGLDQNSLRAIGTAEWVGAGLLLFHRWNLLGVLGALMLMAITGGAVSLHLRHNQHRAAIPALIMFVLTAIVLFGSAIDTL